MLDLILFLDDFSRTEIKSTVVQLTSYGVNIITSWEELNNRQDDLSGLIVVLLDKYYLTKNAISNLELYKEAYGFNYIYISEDGIGLNLMEPYTKIYKHSISELNYDLLSSAIFEEENEELVQSNTVIDDIYVSHDTINNLLETAYKLANDSNCNFEIQNISKALLTLSEVHNIQFNKIKELQAKIKTNDFNLNTKDNYIKLLESKFSEYLRKSEKENTKLRKMKKLYEKDVYTKISLDTFPNRPFVLYLKEYSELLHLNSFINTLYKSITSQGINGSYCSCKILQLYDNCSIKRFSFIPTYYKIIDGDFYSSDLISNDYIAVIGPYVEVLNSILDNPAKLDILIVIDCKIADEDVLLSPDLRFNLCRNGSILFNNKLNKDIINFTNTIINNNLEYTSLSWDTLTDYEDLKDMDKQAGTDNLFIKLSSSEVIINILEAIEKKIPINDSRRLYEYT